MCGFAEVLAVSLDGMGIAQVFTSQGCAFTTIKFVLAPLGCFRVIKESPSGSSSLNTLPALIHHRPQTPLGELKSTLDKTNERQKCYSVCCHGRPSLPCHAENVGASHRRLLVGV
jgi:hypothetical protein